MAWYGHSALSFFAWSRVLPYSVFRTTLLLFERQICALRGDISYEIPQPLRRSFKLRRPSLNDLRSGWGVTKVGKFVKNGGGVDTVDRANVCCRVKFRHPQAMKGITLAVKS